MKRETSRGKIMVGIGQVLFALVMCSVSNIETV